MIRSWIGIVCVLVSITTCVQSSAAQAFGDHSSNPLRERLVGAQLQTLLHDWIELADQGVSDRILCSDAYHDNFRFRAAPIKPIRNWQMPIVDVRPAKILSARSDRKTEPNAIAAKPQTAETSNVVEVANWVWESAVGISGQISSRYGQLRDQFEQFTLAVIPRPRPLIVNPSSIDPRQSLETGHDDYWNYYADCDRWNVVFAMPIKPTPSCLRNDQQAVNTIVPTQQAAEVSIELQKLAAQVADRWESAISLCRAASQQFLQPIQTRRASE